MLSDFVGGVLFLCLYVLTLVFELRDGLHVWFLGLYVSRFFGFCFV